MFQVRFTNLSSRELQITIEYGRFFNIFSEFYTYNDTEEQNNGEDLAFHNNK